MNGIYKPYMKKGKEVRGKNATSFTVHLFLAPNQLSGTWAQQYQAHNFGNYLDISLQINNGKQTYTPQGGSATTVNPGDLQWGPRPVKG